MSTHPQGKRLRLGLHGFPIGLSTQWGMAAPERATENKMYHSNTCTHPEHYAGCKHTLSPFRGGAAGSLRVTQVIHVQIVSVSSTGLFIFYKTAFIALVRFYTALHPFIEIASPSHQVRDTSMMMKMMNKEERKRLIPWYEMVKWVSKWSFWPRVDSIWWLDVKRSFWPVQTVSAPTSWWQVKSVLENVINPKGKVNRCVTLFALVSKNTLTQRSMSSIHMFGIIAKLCTTETRDLPGQIRNKAMKAPSVRALNQWFTNFSPLLFPRKFPPKQKDNSSSNQLV